jgi:hypothetical protein
MLDWLRYHYKLARLQTSRRRVLTRLRKKCESIDPAMSREERGEAYHEAYHRLIDEEIYYDDEKASLKTDYLYALTAKRLIPFPEKSWADLRERPKPSSKWRLKGHTEGCVLTSDAIREVRVALRADRRERLEIVRSWVGTIAPGLTALTGLIGTIIGLLAFFLGRR